MCIISGGGEYPPSIPPAPSAGLRVLVVEDDELLAAITRVNLERGGYTVTSAADGLDALEELQRAEFDCIVLDLRMKMFDGEQMIDVMAFDHPSMLKKIVIVTGFTARGEKLRDRVGDVLIKPVARGLLERTVGVLAAVGRMPENTPSDALIVI